MYFYNLKVIKNTPISVEPFLNNKINIWTAPFALIFEISTNPYLIKGTHKKCVILPQCKFTNYP